MRRTNKHAGEKAKALQQPAFKTPAQDLEEFKAKVLAMKHGPFIWLDLDAYSVWEWTGKLRTAVGYEEFLTAYPEVLAKSFELWPEYERLLKRVPDALKAYKERYEQNRVLHKVGRDVRDLQKAGRTRKLAARDVQIAHMHDVQGCSFGQIAQKLKIYDKHGAPSGAKAYSAYRRYKVESKTKFPPNSDTET